MEVDLRKSSRTELFTNMRMLLSQGLRNLFLKILGVQTLLFSYLRNKVIQKDPAIKIAKLLHYDGGLIK